MKKIINLTNVCQHVKRSERRFDVSQLPSDIFRVYENLKRESGENYALLIVFVLRTAVELHRAWNMTILSSKILHLIKDKFKLRMTWSLGVLRLKFRIEDGQYQIHRKVPYDYDSEFQDIYMRIATALVDGHITVHEALIYQTETKRGDHTANSGLFLRDFPGRIILYPLEAATCTVIFFGGDFVDGGIAAVCGLVAGLVDYIIGLIGGEAKYLLDLLVGMSTGVIASLFYQYGNEPRCLRAIFMGTLYWFFYGTAFVIGLLEIISGEYNTGVTRFIAVSVKTFVLCLGASLGMLFVIPASSEEWRNQELNFCDPYQDTFSEIWWRIPLYLLCCVSVLGQYRFPIINYWRGLIVQLVAYEVQFEVLDHYSKAHARDNLDTAWANLLGAFFAVIAAFFLSYIIDRIDDYYYTRILHHKENYGIVTEFLYKGKSCFIKIFQCIGRRSRIQFRKVGEKIQQQIIELNDPNNPREEVVLEPQDQKIFYDIVIQAQSQNVWAVLMPAVYQLVPGSVIAKLWFNTIFPPAYMESEIDNVFSDLMVISASLALGLIIGFTFEIYFQQIVSFLFTKCRGTRDEKQQHDKKRSSVYGCSFMFGPNELETDKSIEEEEKKEDEEETAECA